MQFHVRKVQVVGTTKTISLPQNCGFEKGDSIKVEQIDEKTIKLTKVE